jgi:CCR4-NOT transcription complex subunit 9
VQQGIGGKLLLLPNGAPPPSGSEEEKIYILITELLDPETRETALLELSKKREMYEDLALVLWGGFGEWTCFRILGSRVECFRIF